MIFDVADSHVCANRFLHASNLKFAQRAVVALIGATAAGKTTVRRVLTNNDAGAQLYTDLRECRYSSRVTCCGAPFTHRELPLHLARPGNHKPAMAALVPARVCWTTFHNNTAVPGTGGSGADANANLDAINYALNRCIAASPLTVFDGLMASKGLVQNLQSHRHPGLVVLWVFLDPGLDALKARLSHRRALHGGDRACLSDSCVQRLQRSAAQLWSYIQQTYTRVPFGLVELRRADITPQAAAAILKERLTLLAGYSRPANNTSTHLFQLPERQESNR